MPKLIVLGLIAAFALYAIGGARAGELAYAEWTSPVSVSATVESSPTAIVTTGAVTYAAEKLRIEWFTPSAFTASAYLICNLYDGTTNLGRIAVSATTTSVPMTGIRYLTPSAGSHTYNVGCWRASGGSGDSTVNGGSGGAGNMPGFLRVSNESAGGGGGAVTWDDVTDKPTFTADWLTDVDTSSAIDGAVLKYDDADSTWKVATDDAGGGSSGPVTLSAGDRERLDLAWWGVWALVGLALLALIAPAMYRLLDVRQGMGGRFERG